MKIGKEKTVTAAATEEEEEMAIREVETVAAMKTEEEEETVAAVATEAAGVEMVGIVEGTNIWQWSCSEHIWCI